MIVYHSHPDTGRFLGTSQADPDPLELLLAQEAAAAPILAAYDALAPEDRSPTALQAAMAEADQARQAVAPTVWLVPAHATFAAPPTLQADEVAVWVTGEGWRAELVPGDDETPADPMLPDLKGLARAERDGLILAVRWLVDRHRDEIALGITTTLTGEDYLLVLTYIQALRDVPEQSGFPENIAWPTLPAELVAAGD